MVSIETKEQAAKFLSLIDSSSKPPGFFAAVKTLCLPFDSVTPAQAYRILSACTGVRILACWVNYTDRPELPELLSRLPLRRLSVEFRHLLKIPTTSPTWLSSLTHIDLVIWGGSLPAAELSNLSRLPCLTHVALPSEKTGPAHAAVVFSVCSLLQVLVMVNHEQFDDSGTADDYLFDSRIVVQMEPQDLITDWEASYHGNADMWSRAEDVIEQRKALRASGTDSPST